MNSESGGTGIVHADKSWLSEGRVGSNICSKPRNSHKHTLSCEVCVEKIWGVNDIPQLEELLEGRKEAELPWKREKLRNAWRMRVPTRGKRHRRGERAGNIDARKRVTQSQRRQLGRDGFQQPSPTYPLGTGGGQQGCLPPGRKRGCREVPPSLCLGESDLYPCLSAVSKRIKSPQPEKISFSCKKAFFPAHLWLPMWPVPAPCPHSKLGALKTSRSFKISWGNLPKILGHFGHCHMPFFLPQFRRMGLTDST